MTNISTLFFSNIRHSTEWHPSPDEPVKWKQFTDDQLRSIASRLIGVPIKPESSRGALIHCIESRKHD